MKVYIESYRCRGWCDRKTGEAKRYELPEPGYLVTLVGDCPHKGGNSGSTTCFMEIAEGLLEVVKEE